MSQPTPSRALPAFQEVEKGILIMAFAMLLLPCMDALAKILQDSMPAGQVAWSRFAFQVLYLAPFMVLGRRFRVVGPIHLHAARGLLIATATLLFFAALKYLPIADAISIFFVEPLILTLLAALLLGEKIGWRRMTAVAFGFVGALIVIQPSYAVFGWAAALPLGAAGCFAVYLILTRQLAGREDPAVMQFLAGIFGCLGMSLALLVGGWGEIPVLDPVWPSLQGWGLMAALGLIATVGHIMVVQAFKRAGPGTLAPFQYLEIIGATLLGYLIFDDFPAGLTWLGIAIIVASGLYVFHRERRLARAAA